MNPDAWLVVYQFQGECCNYVVLDKALAENFAVKYHGIIYPLYRG